MSQPRKPIRPRLLTAAAAAFLLDPTLAGCSIFPHHDKHVVCVDANGIVVDSRYCDDYHGGGGVIVPYFYSSYSGGSYPIGSRLPTGSPRINPADPAARANAGLPRTGKIGGTTIRSGGFGHGISGGSAHGGGGGGAHGGSGGG